MAGRPPSADSRSTPQGKAFQPHPLDMRAARRVGAGALLARSGTGDVIDGHVTVLAGDLNATVFTSDPDDITKLDPTLTVVHV